MRHPNLGSAAGRPQASQLRFPDRPEDYFVPERAVRSRRVVLGRTVIARAVSAPRHYAARYQLLLWLVAFLMLAVFYRV